MLDDDDVEDDELELDDDDDEEDDVDADEAEESDFLAPVSLEEALEPESPDLRESVR